MYRRRCVRLDCGKRFETRNVRRVYCKPRCAYYVAWAFRREAARSGWAT